MNAVTAKFHLMEALKRASGFEPHRKYLGMSRIAGCPLATYRSLVNGRYHEMGPKSTRRFLRGDLFERDTIQRLTEAGIYQVDSKQEVIAAWDDRFRGHTDGESVDGDLLEIKSLRQEDYERVVGERKPLSMHLAQIQMYLRHGKYAHGLVVYISTETYEHFILDVYPLEKLADELDAKARMILNAVDRGEQPGCTCGRCFESRVSAICQGSTVEG